MSERNSTLLHELASKYSVLRTRDFERLGVPRYILGTLLEQGDWERCGRGLYRSMRRVPNLHHSLVEVASRVPQAVICLLSALRFHDLTSERPSEVWIALPRNAWTPSMDTVRLKVTRFSGAAFSEGIEQHQIEGVTVRVYSAAKTVADCFKFRNQIGTKTAVDALREAWQKQKVTTEDLYRYARVCRVLNIMRPYLEGMLE